MLRSSLTPLIRLSFSLGAWIAFASAAFGQTPTSWTGGSANWTSPANWNNGVPNGDFNASISAAGTYTVTLNTAESVTNLTLNDANATLSVTNGGTLTVTGTNTVLMAGTVSLNGGTLSGGTWNSGGGTIVATSSGGTISGASLSSTILNLSGNGAIITFANGTNFASGTALTLGSSGNIIVGTGQSSITNVALTMGDFSSLYGGVDNTSLTVGASGSASPSVLYAGTIYAYFGYPTGTNRSILNTGVARNSGSGTLYLNPSGSFTNQGTIDAEGTGTISIQPQGSFSNAGGIISIGSTATVLLKSAVSSANLGTISRATPTTGTLGLQSTLTLAPNLDLAGTGTIIMQNGTGVIAGAGFTLSSSTAARLQSSNGTLSNVNIANNTLDLTPTSSVLTLTNGTTFASGTAVTLGQSGSIYAGTGQSSISNLALTMGDYSYFRLNVDNSTLTFGSSGMVSPSVLYAGSGYVYFGANDGTNRSILNTGVIRNSGSGTFNMNPSGSFTNQGTIDAEGTGTISIFPQGTFSNVGGTISIGSTATVVFASPVSSANLGTFSRATPSTGTLGLQSTLTLAASYDLAGTGTLVVQNGGIIAGAGFTLSSSTAARLQGTGGTLSNVNIANNTLDLTPTSSSLTLTNGTTFASGTAVTLGQSANLYAGTGQSSISNLALTMGDYSFFRQNVDNSTITLGASGSTSPSLLYAGTGYAYFGTNSGTNRSILSTGVVRNSGSGTLYLNPSGNFTNQGTLDAEGTGTLNIEPLGTFSNVGGTIQIGSTATVALASPVSSANLGTFSRATPSSGTLSLQSTLTLAASYDLAGTGTILMNYSGVIAGAGFTLSSSTSARLQSNGGTVSNVNIANNTLDLSPSSTSLTLTNGTTFASGTAVTLGTSATLYAGTGQSTISNLALTMGDYSYFRLNVDNSTVTIGPAGSNPSVLYAGTGYTYFGYADGTNRSILNTGLIRNSGSGSLYLYPSGTFTNQGTIDAEGSGTIFIQPQGSFSNAGGTISIGSTATVVLKSAVSSANLGTFSRATPSTGTLSLQSTLTLAENYDLAGTGTMILQNNGVIAGASFTLSSSTAARLQSTSGTLSNVNIANNTLDLSPGSSVLTLTNGTTFASGTAVTLGTSATLYAGTGQTSIGNLALTMGDYSFFRLNVDNSTVTFGPAGSTPSVLYAGTGYAYFGYNDGTNRSILSTGLIRNSGSGSLYLSPSGSFTNQGTIDAEGTGTIYIQPQGTFSNVGGTISIGSTATVAFLSPISSANLGTFSRATPSTGTLSLQSTLTLAANYDLAATGTMILNGNSGIIAGAGFTLSSSTAARLQSNGGVLSNVNIANNTLDLSPNSSYVTLTNNTSFASGTAVTLGTSATLYAGTGQTSIGNLALTMGNYSFFRLNVDNSTVTFGPAGSNPSVLYAGTNYAYFGYNDGTNRSILSTGLIRNSSSGSLYLSPSGSFTNQGMIDAEGTGTIYIQPQGTFSNVGGTITIGSTATVIFNSPVSSANLGTFSRATPSTGTLALQSTLTLAANFDLAGTGTMVLQNGNGVIAGAGFTLSSSNAARLQSSSGTLSNVNIANNTLDLTPNSSSITLTNGTTFASGTALTLGTGSQIYAGTAQSSIGNLALTMGDSSYFRLGVDNSTVTFGSSGTTSPSVLYAGTGGAYFGYPDGTNRSLISTGLVRNTGTGTLYLYPSGSFTNQGTIDAVGGTIAVVPNGTFTNTGTIQTAAGTIISLGNSLTVTTQSGGFIRGSGSFNNGTNAIGSGGTVAPGNSTTTGKLTVQTLNFTGGSAANFTVRLSGATAGTGYDQLIIPSGGTLTLNNATLHATLSYAALSSAMYFIVDNQSSETTASEGTFNGLPQGALYTSPGLFTANISYTGNTSGGTITGGNDIVLYNITVLPEPHCIALIGLAGLAFAARRRRVGRSEPRS